MRYILAGSLIAFAFARHGRRDAHPHGSDTGEPQSLDTSEDFSDILHAPLSHSANGAPSAESISTHSLGGFSSCGMLSHVRNLVRHFDASDMINQFPTGKQGHLIAISESLEEAARQALLWWIESKDLLRGSARDAECNELDESRGEKLVREAYSSYHEVAHSLLRGSELQDAIRSIAVEPESTTPLAGLESRFAHLATVRISTIVQFVKKFSHDIIEGSSDRGHDGHSSQVLQALQHAERVVEMLSGERLGLVKEWSKRPRVEAGHFHKSAINVQKRGSGESGMDGLSQSVTDDSAGEARKDFDHGKHDLYNAFAARIWALRVEDMVIPAEEMNRLTEDDRNAAGSIEQAINEAAYQSLKWVVDISGLLGHFAGVNVYADANDVFQDYAEYDADRTDLSPEEILEGRTAIESFIASGRTWRAVCELEETDYSSFVQRKVKRFARLFKEFAGALMPENRDLLTEERAAQVVTALERAEEIHKLYSSQPLGLMERWRKWQALEVVDNEPESDEYWRLEDERARSEEVWKSFVAERTRVEEESEQDFLNELESQPKVLKSVRHGPSISRTKAFYKRRRSVPSSLGIVDREGLPRRLKPKTRIASSMKAHVRKHNRAHSSDGESFTSGSASV